MLWITKLSVALEGPSQQLPKLPVLSAGTTLLGFFGWGCGFFKSWPLKLPLLFLFTQRCLTKQMSAGRNPILWRTDSKEPAALVLASWESLQQ